VARQVRRGRLLRELEEIRPGLVVWDVFNRLHSKDERRPDQMLPVLRTLDRIRDTIGCSNLVVHHTRKPSAHGPDLASGGQKLRGPSEFWGWAENSLYLSPTKAKGHIIVEPESKDAMQEPFKVHIETGEGGHRWIFDGAVEAKAERGAPRRDGASSRPCRAPS
jgi:RecA-family ATPase